MDHATVIIIDDDASYRRVLQRRLAQKTSFEILAFASTQAALAEQTATPCHAIILDMMLSDESGLDAITRLNHHFSPAHLIMLTGYASIATTVEAMRRGATDYLAKPIELNALIQRLMPEQTYHSDVEEQTTLTPAQLEWEHIQRTLLAHQGNISATAKTLGMHRRTLQRKLQKLSPRR